MSPSAEKAAAQKAAAAAKRDAIPKKRRTPHHFQKPPRVQDPSHRPKQTKKIRQKKTLEREVIKLIRAQPLATFMQERLTPLHVLLLAVNGETMPDGRPITAQQIGAASVAAPYCHPRYSAREWDEGPPPTRNVYDLSALSPDELTQFAELTRKVRRIAQVVTVDAGEDGE